MILFRKVYKSANDDIASNQELLDKILSTQTKPHNTYSNFYKYGSIAATFFILIGTLSVYPKIKDNLNVSDNTAAIEVKTEDTLNSDIFIPPADNEKSAEASTALENKKTPQSKIENKKESKSSSKQQNVTSKASEKAPSPTLSETENIVLSETAEASLVTPSSKNEVFQEENVSTARAIDTVAVYSGDNKIITQDDAILLADEVFLSDFGEEFLNSTEIKTEFSENYEITRFNENLSYTVIVFTDGLIDKQY